MIGPRFIGDYRIVRPIGEGGMGRVYEAEQTKPIRRRVAVKVLHAGGSERVAQRFEAERQALAMMDHPGIARVFDAGVTDEGQQWLAMELVEGTTLTEYADQAELDLEGRVELFLHICRAVQHAHQKGVIHRDLKPSNVLVSDGTGEPRPKVIDFGVAKAMDLRLTDRTLVTQFGAVIGTPAYMSPEQAEGTTFDVDTRADVYSLGVILYELLVGCLPVDPVDKGYPGFIAYLKTPDESPPRPSERFTTLTPETQEGAARVRCTTPGRLRERLGGDLDWIVMTAVEKQRDRRYDSAGALAADLERYLDGQPVSARPPSRGYVLRKFVGRNRVAVAAVLAVVTSITVGAAAATAGMVRARNEARIAQREARTAQQVSAFMSRLFEEADPQQSRGRELTVRDALNEGARRLETELVDEPLIRMALLRSIGNSFRGMGLFEDAVPPLADALSLAEQYSGDRLEIAILQHDLGYLLIFQSEFERADSLLISSLATVEEINGAGNDVATRVATNLAFNRLRWGQGIAEGDSINLRIRDASAAVLGRTHRQVAIASYIHCWALRELGRRVEALEACEQSLEDLKVGLGEDAPQVVFNSLALGHTRRSLGLYAEARPAYRAAWELNQRLYPDGHPETAYALNGLANAFRLEGWGDSAVSYGRAGVDMLERTLGTESTETAEGLVWLGEALSAVGLHEEAEARVRQALAVDSAVIGTSSQRYATHLLTLGGIQFARGERDSADATMTRALEILEEVEPVGSLRRLEGLIRTAGMAAAVGDYRRAVTLLEPALDQVEESPDDLPVERSRVYHVLGSALVGLGRTAEACAYAPAATRSSELPPLQAPSPQVCEGLIDTSAAVSASSPRR